MLWYLFLFVMPLVWAAIGVWSSRDPSRGQPFQNCLPGEDWTPPCRPGEIQLMTLPDPWQQHLARQQAQKEAQRPSLMD